MKLTLREARQRLAYIYAIASGKIAYGSDFGRLCTIERASDVSRSIKRELGKHATKAKLDKRR